MWKAPLELSYTEGEKFDPTGLTVALDYSDGSRELLDYKGSESWFSFSPSLDAPLKASDKSVTIGYGGKTTTQMITVSGSSGGGDDSTVFIAIAAVAAVLVIGSAGFLLIRGRA